MYFRSVVAKCCVGSEPLIADVTFVWLDFLKVDIRQVGQPQPYMLALHVLVYTLLRTVYLITELAVEFQFRKILNLHLFVGLIIDLHQILSRFLL